MSNPSKQQVENTLYTFKICGIDKEITLELSGETSIQQILAQLSSVCSIKSESLQIRNGTEALSDINKCLNQYNIEDPSNLLVLRDDILYDKDNESKSEEDESKSDDDDSEVEKAIQLHSNDGSIDFINNPMQNINAYNNNNNNNNNIKSPILPSVPPNSYASNSNMQYKHQ
eukprot:391432_1